MFSVSLTKMFWLKPHPRQIESAVIETAFGLFLQVVLTRSWGEGQWAVFLSSLCSHSVNNQSSHALWGRAASVMFSPFIFSTWLCLAFIIDLNVGNELQKLFFSFLANWPQLPIKSLSTTNMKIPQLSALSKTCEYWWSVFVFVCVCRGRTCSPAPPPPQPMPAYVFSCAIQRPRKAKSCWEWPDCLEDLFCSPVRMEDSRDENCPRTQTGTQGKVSRKHLFPAYQLQRKKKIAAGTRPNIYTDFLLHLHRLLEIFPGLLPGRTVSLITVRVDWKTSGASREQSRHFITAVADLGVDVNHLCYSKWP